MNANTQIGEDRLSNLHESMVSQILSRLPTKDVVRTRILSKAWEHKWSCSYNIDIDNGQWPPKSVDNLIDLMNTLVSSVHLRCFHFRCRKRWDLSCVQTWINVALGHDLQSLQVRLHVKGVVFSCTLLHSTSLRILQLVQYCSTLQVRATNFAPNLTSIVLYGLEIVNTNDNSSTMKFDFPVLETLGIKACKWLYVESVEIHAPSLTTFKSGGDNTVLYYDYTIKIIAPRLTKFTCDYNLPEKIIMNRSSLVSAFLYSWHGDPYPCDPVLKAIGLQTRNLLNEATSLEELELSSFMAEASRLGPPLHRHDKVTRLVLRDKGNAEQLLELLHAMPSLQVLRFNMYEWNKYNYEAMEVVPSCIASHLEEVVVSYLNRKAHKYDLVKFLFKNGKQLKRFIIKVPASCGQKLRKIVSRFPTCSPSLSIQLMSGGLIVE